MKPAFLRAAVAILAFRLMWMYVIPAWSEITTDFQNYYTAAWAVRHNHPLIDLYDTSWFQRESESAGMETQTALFNYFTPVSALVMWPVASFSALDAKRIWVVANLIALPLFGLLIMPFALVSLLAMPLGLEAWPLQVMGLGIDLLLATAEAAAGAVAAEVFQLVAIGEMDAAHDSPRISEPRRRCASVSLTGACRAFQKANCSSAVLRFGDQSDCARRNSAGGSCCN